MAERDVHLLDAGRGARGNFQNVIGEVLHGTAIGAGKADGDHALRLRPVERAQHIGALARGRDADGDIARSTQSLDLAGKDLFITHVVGRGGQYRAVGGDGDGGDGRTVLDVAHGKLGREMLGIRGAAAIAEEHDLAAP